MSSQEEEFDVNLNALTIDDRCDQSKNLTEIFGDDHDDDDDDKGDVASVSSDKVTIVDSNKKEKSNGIIFYAKDNSDLYIILTIQDPHKYNTILEEIFNNSDSMYDIINKITESFKDIELIQFKVILTHNKRNYNKVKPDGLCGVRAIYMNHK